MLSLCDSCGYEENRIARKKNITQVMSFIVYTCVFTSIKEIIVNSTSVRYKK